MNCSVSVKFQFLGEMQCIAFRLMLSSCVCVYMCVSVCVSACVSVCVCVCVYAAFVLWTPGKRLEIETSIFF